MADLVFAARDVSIVRNDPDDQYTLNANVVLERGQLVKVDGTTNRWVKAVDTDVATTQCYITIEDAPVIGATVTGIRKGLVDLGKTALASLNYAAPVYASTTAGKLADAGTVKIGQVAGTTAENPNGKILQVDLP